MNDVFLKKALHLAETHRGFCAPNPAVGAVAVKDGQIIAEGYHQGSGHAHAEVEALKQVTDAKDVILYVTLEPCCHRDKKTPPCTDLLIERGIKKVIYAHRDPNPQVAGQGEKTLKAAGIECEHFPLTEIDEFYRSYQNWWQNKMPYVTAKLAMSLDGKIAGENGERINITGAEAQRFTHMQRKCSDAILTTAKTIIADDPLLNVRLENETIAKPIYILDRQLKVPLHAAIFKSAKSLTFFYDEDVTANSKLLSNQENVRYIPVPCQNQRLDLMAVLKLIGNDCIHDLWIEAGGTCFAAFAQQNLLQCTLFYVAPKWLGDNAQNAFTTRNFALHPARQIEWQSLGEDALCKMVFE